MARPLKVFRAHLGFYDTIVAAPSQKAAAAAWGANAREFAQGFASVTKDVKAVEAALAQPGVVLRRPAGTHGAFKAEPDRPAAPKLTAKQKLNAAKAEQKTKADARKKAEQKKRAEARRAAAAEAELAEIEAEEATLRERRRKLQKSFSLRRVK
jgi:colicin import membrane protein